MIKNKTSVVPSGPTRVLQRVSGLARLKKATLALALVGQALLTLHVSRAATLPSISDVNNDLFIGFRALTGSTGDDKVYLVDIGDYTKFNTGTSLTLTSTNTTGLGNILADISTQFGSNWYTSGNVQWGIFGFNLNTVSTLTTIYGSELRPNSTTQSTAWAFIDDNAVRLGIRTNILDGISGYPSGQSTANSSLGYFQSSGLQSGYKDQVTFAGPDFGDQSSWLNIEAPVNRSLDLWRNTSTAVTSPGYFSLSDSATITFIAVPEPSTYGYLGFSGAIAFVIWRRRRSQNVANL